MPSSDIPLIENQLVTIQGKGFTSTSQIWLRASGTKAQGDIQAEVTQANEKSLTFKVPANTIGKKEVILKQDGQEYLLGTLTFKEKERYYTFCDDKNINELAEIDIESGNLIWTGLKMPENGNKGSVFNESGSELVTFDEYGTTDEPTIFRLNMATKEVKEIKLKNLNNAKYFDNIIRFNDKYYAFCYDKDKEELAEIDIESGNLIWNGWKMTGLNIASGYTLNKTGNELVALDLDRNLTGEPGIYRLNMVTKEAKKIKLKNINGALILYGITRVDDKYYTFCFDNDKKELVEIDIESGNLIWTGLKMPEYNSSGGYVFNRSEDEVVAFDAYGKIGEPIILRLNIATKEVKKIKLKNLNGGRNFDDIVIRK